MFFPRWKSVPISRIFVQDYPSIDPSKVVPKKALASYFPNERGYNSNLVRMTRESLPKSTPTWHAELEDE